MLTATEADVAAATLSPETLATAHAAIERDGFVTIGGLISPATTELLTPSLLEDVGLVRERDELTLHEIHTGVGHLQLGLRRYGQWVHPEIVANPLIESVVAEVLGPGAWLGFYNGNVNCPGSTFQPVHFDRPFSWRSEEDAARDGQPWPPPTTTLSCSIALTDITEETGATEVYPGTHRETAVIGWPPGEKVQAHPDLIEQWGPPVPMRIPAGGVCFRDPRMWHRGVPNPGASPRPMLALTFHSRLARHFRGLLVYDQSPQERLRCEADPTLRVLDSGELGDGRLVFHESARAAFESERSRHGVDRNVRFVDDPFAVNHFVDQHDVGGARVVENEPITAYPDE